ncbi:MAG: helix-turn-helix domain-containing protein [Spirochaetia bacterium]|nr:helix-turn-helix domain-containing protein [Spirochaetia bacterium]
MNSLFYFWRIRDITGFTLGVYFFFLAYNIFYIVLIKSGAIYEVPYLLGTDTIAVSIIIISLFLHLQSMFIPKYSWKKIHLLFLLYPLAHILLFFPYLFLDEKTQIEIIREVISKEQITYYYFSTVKYLSLFGNMSLTTYGTFMISRKYRPSKTAPKYKKQAIFAIILLYFLVLLLTYLFYKVLFISFDLTNISTGEFIFLYSSLFLLELHYQAWPYYAKYGRVYLTTTTFHFEKYFSQYLEKADIQHIEKSLSELFEKKQIHRIENIKLGDVAKAAKITTHQLSTFINEHLNQTFAEFINTKRIEEAIKILKEKPESNILNVCYDTGFNSPSVFYKTFKKETGMVPKDWLKSTLKY